MSMWDELAETPETSGCSNEALGHCTPATAEQEKNFFFSVSASDHSDKVATKRLEMVTVLLTGVDTFHSK